jgi:hypothetical protein
MSKRLPYFQFEPAEWLAGDIMFCTLQAQGLFATIKALYWQKDCDLLLEQAIKRLKNEELFDELISEKIIKIKSGKIKINFLDEQFEKASNLSNKNAKNGLLGGRPELQNELTALNGEVIPRYPEKDDHFLYVFKRKSNGSYKIGETKDLFKRRLTIKVPTADLAIIHFVKIEANMNLEIEKKIKEKFSNCQISGDWFNFNDNDLSILIAEMDRQKNPKKSLKNQYIEDKIKEEDNKIKEDFKEEEKKSKNEIFGLELLESQTWIETISMQNKIAPDGIKKWIETFNQKLITELDTKISKKDYAGHFSRWLPGEISKIKKEGYGKSESLARPSARNR